MSIFGPNIPADTFCKNYLLTKTLRMSEMQLKQMFVCISQDFLILECFRYLKILQSACDWLTGFNIKIMQSQILFQSYLPMRKLVTNLFNQI